MVSQSKFSGRAFSFKSVFSLSSHPELPLLPLTTSPPCMCVRMYLVSKGYPCFPIGHTRCLSDTAFQKKSKAASRWQIVSSSRLKYAVPGQKKKLERKPLRVPLWKWLPARETSQSNFDAFCFKISTALIRTRISKKKKKNRFYFKETNSFLLNWSHHIHSVTLD